MPNSEIKETRKLFSGENIIKALPELAYVFDEEGKFILWNNNIKAILGYSKDELLNMSIHDFQEPEDSKRITKKIKAVFETGKEDTIEYSLITKSGKKIPCLGTGNLTIINNKKYFLGISINITKQKDAESKVEKFTSEIKLLKDQLQAENNYFRENIKNRHEFSNVFGDSELLLNILFQIKQVSKTKIPVLLYGEIGTKKESFAHIIHELSEIKDNSIIKIDCSNISQIYENSNLQNPLVEIEKFISNRIKLAKNGTLLIDNINELPKEAQVIMLYELKKNNTIEATTSVRIIATTNSDLEALIEKNLFNKNLYFFINKFTITIPPLRERIIDIPVMVENFIVRYNEKYGKSINKVPKKTMALFKKYNWPANSRELENVIERAVILSNTSILKAENLIKLQPKKVENFQKLEDFEREYIIKVLNSTFWQVSGNKGAAVILGLHPETLRSKMRKLNINKPEYI